ncbi:hypothetical protein B0H16DRAFT_1737144 [Mycena metata]|uniref:Uncharacterized protein n=1 Tax=Mycena metata TaxID=1033252 RepID=A0AAD7HNC0_9AGAR|nr:hypothetical protein B0H16DRAFT_1737144 [Mycena metata]
MTRRFSAEDAQIAADHAMAQQIYQKEKDRLACRRSEIKEARDALGKNWANKRSEKVRTPTPAASTAAPAKGTMPKSVKVEGFSKANVEAPAPVAEATTIPKRERKVHDLKDRIALQKMRRGDLAAKGWSGYTDQGIEWDANGNPFDAHTAPSRGNSVIDPEKINSPSLAGSVKNAKGGPSRRHDNTDVREEMSVGADRPNVARTAPSVTANSSAKSRTRAHMDPESSDSSSSSDSEGDSEGYSSMPSTSYDSDSEESDSAWEKDPMEFISEVYSSLPNELGADDKKPSRVSAGGAGHGGGPPSESSSDAMSSSSSQSSEAESEHKPRKRKSRPARKKTEKVSSEDEKPTDREERPRNAAVKQETPLSSSASEDEPPRRKGKTHTPRKHAGESNRRHRRR